MKTMKALVYECPAVCSIRDIPIPMCEKDEVRIRVMAASICKGADRRHHTTGHELGQYPITTGHEFAGFIDDIGQEVAGWRVGDRVVANNMVPCGRCYFCQRGMFNHCEHLRVVGHSIPGGFAQFVKVKSSSLIRIPDHLSFNEASMTEPVACCIHAMDRLDVKYGEDVLVFGAGPNGMILSQLLKHSNANRVICLAPNAQKLMLLSGYGVETIQIDMNRPEKHIAEVRSRLPHGADAIVDATGSARALCACIPLLKKAGRLLQFSSTKNDEMIEINPAYFYRNELQYFTTYCQAFEFSRAMEALASGKVIVDRLITRVYPLEAYAEAIEDVMDRSVLKLVIRPNGMDDEMEAGPTFDGGIM